MTCVLILNPLTHSFGFHVPVCPLPAFPMALTFEYSLENSLIKVDYLSSLLDFVALMEDVPTAMVQVDSAIESFQSQIYPLNLPHRDKFDEFMDGYLHISSSVQDFMMEHSKVAHLVIHMIQRLDDQTARAIAGGWLPSTRKVLKPAGKWPQSSITFFAYSLATTLERIVTRFDKLLIPLANLHTESKAIIRFVQSQGTLLQCVRRMLVNDASEIDTTQMYLALGGRESEMCMIESEIDRLDRMKELLLSIGHQLELTHAMFEQYGLILAILQEDCT